MLYRSEIRVDDAVLRSISPYFQAMLRDRIASGVLMRFGEGQELAKASVSTPARIPLPFTHPDAMEVLCKILHGQKAFESGDAQPPSRILSIARVTEYFLVCDAMHYAKSCLLQTVVPPNSRGRRELFAAAWKFGDANAVARLGRDLLLKDTSAYNSGEFSDDGLDDIFGKVPQAFVHTVI